MKWIIAAASLALTGNAHARQPYNRAELIVTWPGKGGNDYRRIYPSIVACERAQRVVLDDNARRQSESDAEAASRAPPGYHLLQGAQVPKASAICLPI